MPNDFGRPEEELIELLARLIARRHVNRHRSALHASTSIDHPPPEPKAPKGGKRPRRENPDSSSR